MVLDGGLATTLELRGHELNDDLWSARLLVDDPAAIRRVHLDFLLAGADCITTSTYQASLPGFRKRGIDAVAGADLLLKSVRLAVEAREFFWRETGNRRGRIRPIVAASVGPYGASLADGSEYTGDYGVDDSELRAFHKDRWDILSASGADLLACETIPSRTEAMVLRDLLRETPGAWAWLSFSCRDGAHLRDGSAIADVVAACGAEPRVAAIGVNCTAPEYVSELISSIRHATKKPIVVYPNSGETYDASSGQWAGDASYGWDTQPTEWVRLGASGVGGCCRIGPREIAGLRRALL